MISFHVSITFLWHIQYDMQLFDEIIFDHVWRNYKFDINLFIGLKLAGKSGYALVFSNLWAKSDYKPKNVCNCSQQRNLHSAFFSKP